MVVFRAWISEMMAIILAEEIARDLPSAELMMTRCKEHKAEIDSRQDAVNKFLETGKVMIENGHFLSEEVPLYVLFFLGSSKCWSDIWYMYFESYNWEGIFINGSVLMSYHLMLCKFKCWVLSQIKEKVTDLNTAWEALLKTFEQYQELCEQNLEAQVKFKHLRNQCLNENFWNNI